MSPRATSRRSPGPRSRTIPKLYKQFYSQTSFTWGKTLGSGQAITQGNRNPLLGRVPGADGLKTGHTDEAGYGFTGSAEQNGRRLVMVVAGLDSFNQRIEESVRLMEWGFNAWQSKPLFKAGADGRQRQGPAGQRQRGGAGRAARPGGHHSRGRAVQGPVDQDPLPGPGQGADRQGPAYRRPGRHHPRHGEQVMPLVAAEAVGEAGFFGRAWIGLKQLLGMA